jgi:hypothetical protein
MYQMTTTSHYKKNITDGNVGLAHVVIIIIFFKKI